MAGTDERLTPGNTLAVQRDKPFSGLAKFGTAFLNRCVRARGTQACAAEPGPLPVSVPEHPWAE